MKMPHTRRAAKRSLMFESTPDGRVLVGSMWMPIRIIADSVEKGTEVALRYWLTGDFQ